MTPDQKAGLTRLMLRWPDRRKELEQFPDGPLVELLESYEQSPVALDHWSNGAELEARALATIRSF